MKLTITGFLKNSIILVFCFGFILGNHVSNEKTENLMEVTYKTQERSHSEEVKLISKSFN
jgi:hypothetical protein